jgi:hypothetical protein
MGRPWSPSSVRLAFWKGLHEGLSVSVGPRLAGVSRPTAYLWLSDDRQVLPSPIGVFRVWHAHFDPLRLRRICHVRLTNLADVSEVGRNLFTASFIAASVTGVAAQLQTRAARASGARDPCPPDTPADDDPPEGPTAAINDKGISLQSSPNLCVADRTLTCPSTIVFRGRHCLASQGVGSDRS